jgi:iron(III) transport system substrate-binding protein
VASAASGGAADATGWQAEWERRVAAARQEGRVVLYGPPGDQVRIQLTSGFEKTYPGIALELTGGRCSDLTPKLAAERQAGLYALDVYLCGTTTANSEIKPMGALEPIPPALLLPEVTDPESWIGGRHEYSDKEGALNLVFATTAKMLVAYDPRQVRPEDIDTLPKLLDPKWKGKIVIGDPTPPGASQVVFRWFWEVLGPAKGTEYIRALREQAAYVDRDARRMIEMVARGRYPILVGPNDALLQQLKMEGMEVAVLSAFQDHGGVVNSSYGTLMLLERAPHPNAAVVFANWLLSKEGQTAYSKGMNQASRRLDAPTDHLPPEARMLPNVTYWPSYTEDNSIGAPAFTQLINELFNQ